MRIRCLRHSLIFKMVLSGGVTLVLCVALWIAFNIFFFRENVLRNVRSDIAMLSDTILLGLNYAMMLDSEEDITEIIQNISRQEEIKSIRIYNKRGRIAFSNVPDEVDTFVHNTEPACQSCHKFQPPPTNLDPFDRTRVRYVDGNPCIRILTPIPNTPSCTLAECHFHTEREQLLGVLDMEVGTEAKSAIIGVFERTNLLMSFLVFSATFTALFAFTYRSIFTPIRRLIRATRDFAAYEKFQEITMSQADEIGALAAAFNNMAREVSNQHAALVEQREEYRDLFQNVPCLVSVVDREFRVIRHNNHYKYHFGSSNGKHCYEMNKGLSARCEVCPVEQTFRDGQPHMSEETGRTKDGQVIHWIVSTAPVRDKKGEIVAAMEMMIEVTQRKELEEKLAASESRYQAIFDATPNALFVLDAETLRVIHCNGSVGRLYGYSHDEMIGQSILRLFRPDEREDWNVILRSTSEIDQCSQLTKEGRLVYITMRISPTEFRDLKVFIVSCADITRKLTAEQHLIQASKMATLGEMAAGVAHELNQPLGILKTISSLLLRKISRHQTIEPAMLQEIAEGIDTHVDRASKIIEHMREFGRKSDLRTMPVNLNDVLRQAFTFFSQQLSVRNIQVEWELDERLPSILADSNRLEQVVINLLLNARDAIEEQWRDVPIAQADRRITIHSQADEGRVVVRVCDTGTGIPPGLSAKLFEPFFTTKDVGKGTGLGLSISYGIVTDYGGTIRAENMESGGACFVITFPRAPSA